MLKNLVITVSILGGLGLIFGLALSFASKKFAVAVDDKVAKIRAILPGANCGACGFSGCDAFAENLAAGRAKVNGCSVGGKELAADLGDMLGEKPGEVEQFIARVMCGGTWTKCKQKYTYRGIVDCNAAANLHGGPSACPFGCVGMGDCARACAFGAIEVEDGLARVNPAKCTGCGMCVQACPKKIIKMVPVKSEYTVLCSSTEKGAFVVKTCKAGCIGCGRCVKVCPSGAITMKGPLAEINPDLCTNCGECMKVCPTKVIQNILFCPETGREVAG
ncbi:MAG: RnfABCDGE type electron transport complex subunit B [Eubacteriales bacterium]|nr:RnfABCDGE type electron transport complex subunit B [Eubacteriales bacterium]